MPEEKNQKIQLNELRNKNPQRVPDPIPVKPVVIQKKFKAERNRLLLIVGILIAILATMVVYATIKVGGVQNLISGNKNPISNIIDNTGSAIVNPTAVSTATPTPTEFTIPDIGESRGQIFLDRDQNFVSFIEFSSDNDYVIKKGSFINFQNRTGKIMGLQFSDGRQVRLELNGEENELFAKPGVITFYDALDTTNKRITGTITVVN